MNKYVNEKTGAVIETECELKGADWKPVKEAKGKAAEKKGEKKK